MREVVRGVVLSPVSQFISRCAVAAVLALGAGPLPAWADIQFEDVSAAAGITHSAETYGATWGDLNSDGFPDIAISNHRSRGSLYVNQGNGRFVDIGGQIDAWVKDPSADTHGLSFSDFDNDGDQDFLVSAGVGDPNQMLVNEGGALLDRTFELGLPLGGQGGRMALWFDMNRDRRADMLLANRKGETYVMVQSGDVFVRGKNHGIACIDYQYAQFSDVNADGGLDLICGVRETGGSTPYPQFIYDIRTLPFQDITSAMPPMSRVVDSITADFDGDLRDDVFAVRGLVRPSGVHKSGSTVEALLMGGTKGMQFTTSGKLAVTVHWNRSDQGPEAPRIWVGSKRFKPGSTTFTLDPADTQVDGQPAYTASDRPLITIGYERAKKRWTFKSVSGGGQGGFNNAYLVVTSTSSVSAVRGLGMWAGDKPVVSQLLLNTAAGYVDATVRAGLAAPVSCASAAAGDMDNDGDVDLYLTCRTGPANIANILFENRGDGSFATVAGVGGASGPVGLAVSEGAGTADSVIIGDYDVDGALDLFIANGLNMRPYQVGGPHTLLRNKTKGNHWIELDLVATRTLREALGARVYATANGKTQLRTQNGGYHRWSQDSTRLHFGLGSASTVDLKVEWPSGRVENYPGVVVDKLYRATEGGGIRQVVPGGG